MVGPCRWRAATQLSGCQPDDPSIDAFWGAIARLTEEERGMVRTFCRRTFCRMSGAERSVRGGVGGAQVLAFATGCPRLPAVGGTAPNFVISINHHAVRSA